MVGATGWYLDARREYDQLDAHDHGLRLVAETHGTGAPAPVVIPEGIHMPGPSAWPFLAPIGLFFIFLGLVLGPLLIVAGVGHGRCGRHRLVCRREPGVRRRSRPGTPPSR